MKRTIAIILSVVFVTVCASNFALAADKKIKIGMVNFISSAAYFVGMDKAVHEEADVYENIEVFSTDAKFDIAKLASDIEDLITKGVDGLIISAGPTETLPASLMAIQKAGIPTVFVDRLWKNTRLTTPWNWVGAQNTYMGEQLGGFIVKELDGKGFVLIVRGGPADNSIGIDRTEGMIGALKGTQITYEKSQDFGGWGVDGGYKVMADMLARHKKIDAVFCENDSMCLGALKAVADAGRSSEMFFAASDAGKETLREMMREGSRFKATAVNDSDQIGRTGFHHLMGLLAGAKLPNVTPLPSPMILQDEAIKFYDPNKVF